MGHSPCYSLYVHVHTYTDILFLKHLPLLLGDLLVFIEDRDNDISHQTALVLMGFKTQLQAKPDVDYYALAKYVVVGRRERERERDEIHDRRERESIQRERIHAYNAYIHIIN